MMGTSHRLGLVIIGGTIGLLLHSIVVQQQPSFFLVSGLVTTTVKYRVVWFRPHALRSLDNQALWRAANEHQNNDNNADDDNKRSQQYDKLRFVFLWDHCLIQDNNSGGGTASDVFVLKALEALNETLQGRLEIIIMEQKNILHQEEGVEGIQEIASRQVKAISSYAQDMLLSAAASSGDDTVEIFYLETYDRALESSLAKHLQGVKKESHQIRARNFGGSHTLIDYNNNHLNPTSLLKNAIEEHTFSSPLIPFVDFVMNQLKNKPLLSDTIWTCPTLPPATTDLNKDIIRLHQHHNHPSNPTTKFNNSEVLLRHISLEELGSTIGTTRNTYWGKSLSQRWPASEDAAAQVLHEFVYSQYPSLLQLQEQKDSPQRKTKKRTHLASYLSPYIARGLLSPKQIYCAIQEVEEQQVVVNKPQSSTTTQQVPQQQGGNSFLRRLAWRDYAYVVSMVFPDSILHDTPIRSGYETIHNHYDSIDIDNTDNSKQIRDGWLLKQWKRGMTGFPLVDAGMRQLITEGFMPQQVRLAVSACLVEGLNIPNGWKLGRRHFEEYLIDHDAMINTNMWQNAGGVGLDPYYIGLDYKKRPYWDADGSYVRTWCPELEHLPDRIEIPPSTRNTGGTNTVDCLYTPWKAPPKVLEAAQVALGDNYPQRICDEREGRRQFLQALRRCRSSWPLSKIDSGGKDVIEFSMSERIGVFTPKSLML